MGLKQNNPGCNCCEDLCPTVKCSTTGSIRPAGATIVIQGLPSTIYAGDGSYTGVTDPVSPGTLPASNFRMYGVLSGFDNLEGTYSITRAAYPDCGWSTNTGSISGITGSFHAYTWDGSGCPDTPVIDLRAPDTTTYNGYTMSFTPSGSNYVISFVASVTFIWDDQGTPAIPLLSVTTTFSWTSNFITGVACMGTSNLARSISGEVYEFGNTSNDICTGFENATDTSTVEFD